MLVSCRVVRKNRTYSQLTTNLMALDTSSITDVIMDVRKGDSSILVEESYIIGGFIYDESDTNLVDSIQTQAGKVVVSISPLPNGKKVVSYKATTPARKITPGYEQKTIKYNKKQSGASTSYTSKANVETATTKRSNLNGWVLAALFVSIILYLIFLIFKYLKK